MELEASRFAPEPDHEFAGQPLKPGALALHCQGLQTEEDYSLVEGLHRRILTVLDSIEEVLQGASEGLADVWVRRSLEALEKHTSLQARVHLVPQVVDDWAELLHLLDLLVESGPSLLSSQLMQGSHVHLQTRSSS